MSTDKSTRLATKRVLLDAADIVEKRGWVKGSLRTNAGAVCATGAIAEALGVEFDTFYNSVPAYRAVSDHPAGKALANALDPTSSVYLDASAVIIHWNDLKATDRAEVIANFREVANSVMTEDEEAKFVLIEAAHVLERDGWRKWAPFTDYSQECCAIGAVGRAAGVEKTGFSAYSNGQLAYGYVRDSKAGKVLAETIAGGRVSPWSVKGEIYRFNDNAENKWQVIAKLYEAAASIEVGK